MSLSIDDINYRIKKEICNNCLDKISDKNLYKKYIEQKSVKEKVLKLSNIIKKYTSSEICDNIITEYILELIPPGTKGWQLLNLFIFKY